MLHLMEPNYQKDRVLKMENLIRYMHKLIMGCGLQSPSPLNLFAERAGSGAASQPNTMRAFSIFRKSEGVIP